MSIQDSGVDVVIELKNEFVRDVFETMFRQSTICPAINFSNLSNPFNPGHTLGAKDFIPRLQSTDLRQVTKNNKPVVYLDLTLEPSVGTLYVDSQSASQVTLPIEIQVSVSQGKVYVKPNVGILAAFVTIPSISLPLDLLASSNFSLTPTSAGVKLVGSEKNLALGLDVDLTGTIRQFSGDCKKSTQYNTNTNLNTSTSNMSKFLTGYTSAVISSSTYADVVMIVDEGVIGAMIKTVSIDLSGTMENSRLWLISAGPGKMKIGGQACIYHSTCAGDWWDAGWKASAKFVVKSGKILINYEVDDAYMTDTDSGWDSCVNAVDELKKRGQDKGEKDLNIPATIGKDNDPIGKLTINKVQHRDHDALLYATSNLEVLSDAEIQVPSELLFAPSCSAAAQYLSEFEIKHSYSSGSPITVCSFKIEKDSANVFKVDDPKSSFTIKTGEKKTIKVSCSGQPGSNYTADLKILSNGGQGLVRLKALLKPASMQHDVVVQLVGNSYWNLCTDEWHDQMVKEVSLTNNGTGNLKICSINITGDTNNLFAFGCPEKLPVILEPGETLTLKVSFTLSKESQLGQLFQAKLLIVTSLGTTEIWLVGKLEHKYDSQGSGVKSSYGKDILCGKLYYDLPLHKYLPPEVIIKFVDLLGDPPRLFKKGLLFLELVMKNAPRQMSIELLGEGDKSLAKIQGRFHTKFLIFPYLEDQEYSIHFTPDEVAESRIVHFALRNWYYQVTGRVQLEEPVLDFAIRKDHLFVATSHSVIVARIGDQGTVVHQSVMDLPAGAQALTVVGDRLLLSVDGCQVYNIAAPDQPTYLFSLDVPEQPIGLYNPDPHLHHIDRDLTRRGVFNEVAYALGSHLHTLWIQPNGSGELAHSFKLNEPAFGALAWGKSLFLFSEHSLQRFNIENPLTPVHTGEYRSEQSIINGFVIGCMGLLVHEGPALTLVDVTGKKNMSVVGSYVPHPTISPYFPLQGKVFIDGRFTYTRSGERDTVLVGRLERLPFIQEKLDEMRRLQIEAEGTEEVKYELSDLMREE